MNELKDSVLLIAYGNPGRRDDGLGPALAEAAKALNLNGLEIDVDYQLSVEDAAAVAEHRTVLFVDADETGPEPFAVKRIGPAGDGATFSTHSLDPGSVLALARDLFDSEPEAWIFGIRGYEFDEFGEGLSNQAQLNMNAALGYLEGCLSGGKFEELRSEGWDPVPSGADTTNEDESCKTEST